MGELKPVSRPAAWPVDRVMHSYHNVAELRQFRGISCRQNAHPQ
jgi:hypothetical protein